MTKQDYVTEMLSEALPVHTVEYLREIAKTIVDGLDMWYEMSGDSVATSNRYGHLEREKEEAIKKIRKEYEVYAEKHKEEMAEQQRNARWALQRKQREIEELQKQIR